MAGVIQAVAECQIVARTVVNSEAAMPPKNHPAQKKPPMRTSEDVIHRIQHDDLIDKGRYTFTNIDYVRDMLNQGVIEKKFNDFVWCKLEMASIYDLAIPKHRIEYFKYHTEVVWSKKDRLDKVFGSSNSDNETIADVIARLQDQLNVADVDEETEESNDGLDGQHIRRARLNARNRRPVGQGLRPTHFICIPFHDSTIRRNVEEVQRTICTQAQYHGNDSHRIRLEACIALPALHMTLVMMRLPTPDAIAAAVTVFRTMTDLLQIYTPRNLLFTMDSVKDFGGRVVYTSPLEVGRVTALVDAIKDRLVNAGVHLVGNHDPFQPHVTIAKLPRGLSRDWNGVAQLDHSIYGKHQWMRIGRQACQYVQFCELHADKHPHTGFYSCLGSVANAPASIMCCSQFIGSDRITSHNTTCFRKSNGIGAVWKRICSVNDNAADIIARALGEIPPSERKSMTSSCNMIILRGMPGSGKSSLAKRMKVAWQELGTDAVDSSQLRSERTSVICVSADDFMYRDGGTFQVAALSGAHARCLQIARETFQKHSSDTQEKPFPCLVIVDNTNTIPAEYAEYLKVCREFNATAGIVEVEATSFIGDAESTAYDCLSSDGAVEIAKGGLHCVPDNAVRRMWARWIPDSQAMIVRRHVPKDTSLQDWLTMASCVTGDDYHCQYVGVVLDEASRQQLLAAYPPKHTSRVRAHHCTLAHHLETSVQAVVDTWTEFSFFSRQDRGRLSLGCLCEVAVYGEIVDCLCQGVVVEVMPASACSSGVGVSGHITISHDPTVPPKYTADILSRGKKDGSVAAKDCTTYTLRHPSDPLVLRGVISACVTKKHAAVTAKPIQQHGPPIYLSHPADIIALLQISTMEIPVSQNGLQISTPVVTHVPYSFDFIKADTRRVCVFDMDDTLLATLSRDEYNAFTGMKWRRKRGGAGFICCPESLDCSLPVGAAGAIIDFHDRCGAWGTKIVVLTGRLNSLQAEVEKLLASRSLLKQVDAVVCKPISFSGDTAAFKAHYVSCMLQECPHLQHVECWDDKRENLDCIAEAHRAISCKFDMHFVDISVRGRYKESGLSAVTTWAESSGCLASEKHQLACGIALEILTNSWHEVCGIPMKNGTSGECNDIPLVHIFGSHVFERRSDVDVMLVLPLTEARCDEFLWMDRLDAVLSARTLGYTSSLSDHSPVVNVVVYKADSGRVPKMSIQFEFLDLPLIEIDVIVLPCVNGAILCKNISLSNALSATVDEIQCANAAVTKSKGPPTGVIELPQKLYDVLYGLAVRNTCLKAIEEVGLTRRDLGALVAASRRVVDGAHAMGTIVRGIRPYLLALAMCTIAQNLCMSRPTLTCDVDDVFLRWVFLTTSCKSNMYPGGLVEYYHLSRLAWYTQSKWSQLLSCTSDGEFCKKKTLIQDALNVLSLPNKLEYSCVHLSISMDERNDSVTENDGRETVYSFKHVLVGILSKYIPRWVRDGHHVIAAPSTSPCSNIMTTFIPHHVIASFGVSVGSIDAVKGSFSAICKDFEQSNRRYKRRRYRLVMHIE